MLQDPVEIMECTTTEPMKLDSDCVMSDPARNLSNGISELKSSLQNQNFADEKFRLSTFQSQQWPYEGVMSSLKLAKAGFFYVGNNGEVQCFSCGVKVKDWKYGDVAVRKHQEISPNCSYIESIYKRASKRIPLNDRNIQGQSQCSSQENQNISQSVNVQNVNFLSTEAFARTGSYTPQISHNENIVSSISGRSEGASTSNSNNHPDFEKMKKELERLRTFGSIWPLVDPKPSDLAHVGFFYLLDGDRVQCAFCRGIVSHWESGDDPLKEHVRHFPFCPFIMKREVGNTPINGSQFRGFDECGSSSWKHAEVENESRQPMKKLNKLENFGVKLHHAPRHPSQASKDARLRSFDAWPSTSPIQPTILVEAGFFYIGIKDYTRCFYCDGGLCNWEAGDDPWVEHARWFQSCAYVRLNKGDAFVESCKRKTSTVQKPEVSVNSQNHNESFSSVQNVPRDNSAVKVDELMESSLVKSVLEPGIFSSQLVRLALLRRLSTIGKNFENVDELCESVIRIQNEIEDNVSEANNTELSSEQEKEECMNIDVRNTVKILEQTHTNTSIPSVTTQTLNNDTIKDSNLCKICMDKEIGVLFLPCGHLIACVQCAPGMSDCPFCRQAIKGTVRAFLT